VLVVMPSGFGPRGAGTARSSRPWTASLGRGTDGLAAAALTATALGGAAHPLPPGAAASGASVGASSGTVATPDRDRRARRLAASASSPAPG